MQSLAFVTVVFYFLFNFKPLEFFSESGQETDGFLGASVSKSSLKPGARTDRTGSETAVMSHVGQ